VINILVTFLILFGSFQFFSFSYSVNGINRSVINTPIEYFNVSVPLSNDDEKINLYFDINKLEGLLNQYYEILVKYSSSYEVSYYYYDTDDNSYCIDKNCTGVEVGVSCKINYIFSYSRTMFYEIGSRI